MKAIYLDDENNEVGSGESYTEYETVEQSEQDAEQDRRNVALRRKYVFLGKWIYLLFILIVPNIVAAILGAFDNVTLALLSMFIELGVSVAYIVILIKLGEVHPDYRKAAMFLIPGVGTDVFGIILIFALLSGTSTELPLWYSGIDTVAGLIGIYGTYLEFMSHADVTAKVDPQQSDQWRNLWKYTVIFCVITILSVFFALIPFLGLIIVFVGVIGIVVCSILKLVYLYRTAKLFQAYGA